MSESRLSNQHVPQTSASRAWRNVLAITLVGSAVFGLACLVLLAGYLRRTMDLYPAAIWLQLGFTIAAAVAFAFVVVWQRSRGSSVSELGWGRPTTPLALFVSVIYVLGKRSLTPVFIAHGI
jgi:hypothetical protein